MKIYMFLIVFLAFSNSVKANLSSNYTLGPGDKIEIRVFGQPDLAVEALLGNSGDINYPFLGKIKLAGLNTTEVEELIVNGLQPDYLVKPNVYTQVVEYRPFYIHGEVEHPGGRCFLKV